MKREDLAPVLGLAIFLVIHATQVWGGVFPFLPTDFQTDNVTLLFYLAQLGSFVAALAASTAGSYWYPFEARRMLVTLATALVAAGSLCVIAAMYAPTATAFLVGAGGVSLGVGMAGYFMLWQRYFASKPPEECNRQLMFGGALAAALYYALYLIPVALTAFLIPIVFLPLGALCLVLSVRTMDFDQPMFEDTPRNHPEVYRQLARDTWRSAVAVAALGFASGLSRGAAIAGATDIGWVVNVASMAGLAAAALSLLALSRFRAIRFGMSRLFRMLYPIVLTGFVLFPFFGATGLPLFAGVTYFAFSAMMLVMMMQAAQISRDQGTNPVFVYGLLACATYAAQGLGFLLGWSARDGSFMGVGETTLLPLVAAYVVGIALFAVTRTPKGARRVPSQIEINPPSTQSSVDEPATAAENNLAAASARLAKPVDLGDDRPDRQLRDRLSKQCLVAQATFGLSSREAEVTELIARGRTVAQIAEGLFISENTVRTHSKHIYTKMDVHSKQELSVLLDAMDLSALDATG